MPTPSPHPRRFPVFAPGIRARLLFAYVGLLLVGFSILTVILGEQIVATARNDYEQRLLNTVQLVAQGIAPYVTETPRDVVSEEALVVLVDTYETQLGATIEVLLMPDQQRPQNGGGNDGGQQGNSEITAAMRGELTVTQRDVTGESSLFTAAPVFASRGRNPVAVVQLSVPMSNLREMVVRRLINMWLVFGIVLIIAVLIALIVARSIIRPLYTLRDSALKLAQGDLTHRVPNPGSDEIGAVASAFNVMAAQVQSMLEEQRAFASNTSHELRTPLTAIRLRSEAIRFDSSLDTETMQQYVAEIDDEAKRLGGLIEDLTLLSRFDAGRAELGGSEIDFVRFAHSLTHSTGIQAQSRRVKVALTAPGDAIPVRASLSHLTVVFRNLLDNAVKFTPEGGQVTWEVRQEADRIISTIHDTGQGIEPDQLPHVFERFYRADKARSRNVPGTGLGLALVKSIVDAYGGTVSIDSAGHGLGATVTVIWRVNANA